MNDEGIIDAIVLGMMHDPFHLPIIMYAYQDGKQILLMHRHREVAGCPECDTFKANEEKSQETPQD